MNEIRQNKVTEQWVIYAPNRLKRPYNVDKQKPGKSHLPEVDAQCPFCEGNEESLPGIIMELPAENSKRWQIRVVPNKYPAVTQTERDSVELSRSPLAGDSKDIYSTMQAYGIHEVIIESPFHNHDIPRMSAKEVEMVIEAYQKRYNELYQTDKSIMCIIIFRNHGQQAGTSLLHPHSQLIATAMVPQHVSLKEKIAQSYFNEHGGCLYCDVLKSERRNGERTVFENEDFLAFVPFAAQVPCEVWIMPKRHNLNFGLISNQEKISLADALHTILKRLYENLNDPDYNYIIHSFSRQKPTVPHLHWYIQIRPRLTTPAGFEIGSGLHINPSIPEEDAKILRQPMKKHNGFPQTQKNAFGGLNAPAS
jgi:UDPglucose--hexose-1-phosphate uridylyltransferase